MVWLIAMLGCDAGPPPTGHGTLLHVGAETVLVQHDDLRGRVVTGVERYRRAEGADFAGLGPGSHVDLWVEGGALSKLVVTGQDALPKSFVKGGVKLAGTVVNVDGVRVTVDHEEIPGVMGAMVMGFSLAPWEAERLATGDVIEARLLSTDYGYQLVDPVKTGTSDAALRTDIAPLEVGQRMPRTELVAQDGTALVVGEGQGTRTLLTYIYTRCPDPAFCPAIAARLAALQERLEGGRIVTVTLDPDNDTTRVLEAWGRAMNADFTRWSLARAEPVVLQELALRGGQHVTVDGGRITHLHRVLLLDEDGTLIERYDDNAWPQDRVVQQLATGQPRAEKTGTKQE
ncbi:MAG: SCO family protein [Alphaproteobacteria bacterium]|nr:SCO family protein [Alphaproteobacteria bacterium]